MRIATGREQGFVQPEHEEGDTIINTFYCGRTVKIMSWDWLRV